MESGLTATPGFCPNCGSILPPLKNSGGVTCFLCNRDFDPTGEFLNTIMKIEFYLYLVLVFGRMEVEYSVHFNKIPSKKSKLIVEDDDEAEGPVIERKCPKCGNDKMSYATLQLRSADEGQTVFYTCTKCSFKETENS